MAKKETRGRPKAEKTMSDRILVRIDSRIKTALNEFAQQSGAGAESTAARIIIVERLKAEGLL